MIAIDSDYSNRPFTGGAVNSGPGFWDLYIASRPSLPESFLQFIIGFHKLNGCPHNAVAHDVGTGPGNMARRLLPFFDRVVGSDVNQDALNVAELLTPDEDRQRMTFINCPAEDLTTAPLPTDAGPLKTDFLLVSECMPLLDASSAMKAFHDILRPGGTLAIYFYGRPIFIGEDEARCNDLWSRLADSAVQCFHPISNSPSFPFYRRSATAMHNWLDNIEVPTQFWENIERLKWNHDFPLSFCGPEGYDFELEVVSQRRPEETGKQVIDRDFWTEEMSAQRVAHYLASVLPGYREQPNAGEKVARVDEILQDLQSLMGGENATRKVTFPLSLILATKKGS